MATYRTKIREIEAFKWNGQPISEFPLWAQDPRYISPSGTAFYVYSLHGPIRVERGTWLIQGDKEIYPCTDDEFQKQYEPLCGTEG
jgi:hypothetical protein